MNKKTREQLEKVIESIIKEDVATATTYLSQYIKIKARAIVEGTDDECKDGDEKNGDVDETTSKKSKKSKKKNADDGDDQTDDGDEGEGDEGDEGDENGDESHMNDNDESKKA